MTETCTCCDRPARPGAAGLCALHQRRKLRGEPMTQPHDLVGQTPSGCGLLGIVERDETGVMCHECGRWLGGLSWHIAKTHQMTVAEYRQRHQLPATVPLVSLGTSALISANSRERVGTPAWQRFERRRDEVLPESRKVAIEAARSATAGTKAAYARNASSRFSGNGERRRDPDRWRANLAAYMAWWTAAGRTPRQHAEDAEERRLASWMSHQRRDLTAGRLADDLAGELRATGIPLGADAERGRKWINQPPPRGEA